jgi:sulfoxide reductase heme-binding subunit YedZ
MSAVATHGPSLWWYVTRGAGATTLVLFSASVALGIAELSGWRGAGASRFTVAALHRSVSLLALALLALHIATTVIDPFPAIGLTNAIVPFATEYRPLWIGLGTIATDLLLVVLVTSLLRRRLGYRGWRVVHWASYAAWPVAVMHGLGAGSDARTSWMALLTAACVLVVLGTAAVRIADAAGDGARRTAAFAGLLLAVVVTAAWAWQGPLASGWARRAGTPEAVLTAFGATGAHRGPLDRRFRATLRGQVHTGAAADGSTVVDAPLRLVGGPQGALRLRLAGTPTQDGRLSVDRSAVALVGAADGSVLRLDMQVRFDGRAASGTLSATPEAG